MVRFGKGGDGGRNPEGRINVYYGDRDNNSNVSVGILYSELSIFKGRAYSDAYKEGKGSNINTPGWIKRF